MATTLFEGSSEENGMPWQVKAIGLVGVPSALAIYLVWALVGDVSVNQQATKENLALHAEQTRAVQEQNIKLIYALEELKRSINRICANTARTTSERSECFR